MRILRNLPRLLAGALLLGIAQPALAGVFCVNTAASLQTALTTAASNGVDDEVRIVQGTYVGNFVYASTQANGLSVLGGYTAGCASRTLNPVNTILDGNQTNRVLVLSAPDAAADFLVEGLTLRNGKRTAGAGGGLLATVGSDGVVTLNNNQIENNTTVGYSYEYPGGGAFISATTATLTNNNITGNTGGGGSGGATIYASTAMLINNNFTGNSGSNFYGGGAEISATTATLTNNHFTSNTAGRGGGVSIAASTATLTNNNISGNTAAGPSGAAGGGVSLYATTATLTNNTLSGNTADSYYGGTGGGVYLSATTATLTNNTLQGNVAGPGGGISVSFRGPATNSWVALYNNLFWQNQTAWDLGADFDIENSLASQVTLFANNFDWTANTGFKVGTPVYIDSTNLNKINPLLVNEVIGDLGSPMIDAGYPDTPDLPATDRAGGLRVVNGIVDIGAFEYHKYESCDVGPLVFSAETFDAGGDHHLSEVSIATEGSVEILSEADVMLRAPFLSFGPGFRIETGAQFMALAGPVSCNQ
jgi:hypothetical protein